jgi:hypothetical protein
MKAGRHKGRGESEKRSGYRSSKEGGAMLVKESERKTNWFLENFPKKKTCLRASPVHGMTMSATGFPTTALPVSGPRVGPCPSQPCGSPSQNDFMSRRHDLVKNDLWIQDAFVLMQGPEL